MSSLRSKKSQYDIPNVFAVNFVIAGGSFAAINAVKTIAQKIIPEAVKINPRFRATVTVIAPNKEAYWNIAAARLVINPKKIDTNTNQIFFNIEETMKQYIPDNSPHKLTIIRGKVIQLKSDYNIVTYMKMDSQYETSNSFNETDFVAMTLTYDVLVLATGASSSSEAFKIHDSAEKTKQEIRKMAQEIKKASSICIIGAGAVGVELAGEIGFKYGRQKKITLYSGVQGTQEYGKIKHSKKTLAKLKLLGVETVLDVRAVTSQVHEKEIVEYDSGTVCSLYSKPKNSYQIIDNDSYKKSLSKNTASYASLHSNSRSPVVQSNRSTPSSPSSSLYYNRSTFDSQHTLSTVASSDEDFISPTPFVVKRTKISRTLVSFDNGYREVFDCCIFATGNNPNTSYIPISSLDNRGYIVTDPYLRMTYNNPNQNIYVFGDLVASGKQTLLDIGFQSEVLETTLIYDVLQKPYSKLKKYKPTAPTYIVPISEKGGVGVLFGVPMPGFVIAFFKSKNFMLEKSNQFLT